MAGEAAFGSILAKWFGTAATETASFAGGLAIAPTLRPVLQDLENRTWAEHPVKPLDPEVAAAIVAEDVSQQPWGEAESVQSGVSPGRFDKLLGEALNGPGFGTLLEMLRRGFIGSSDFEHGLRKAKLETRWDGALTQLQTALIGLSDVAEGIQRGLIAAPFSLPFDASPGGGSIPAYPTTGIDARKVTEGLGFTIDDLQLLVGLAGNPPGPQALYRAKWRGAINDADVERGLVEGRARAEWSPAFEAEARAIPTPHDFVENTIRGYSDTGAMTAGAGRHGMTAEDVNVLYQNAGRPLVAHQITTGLARGGHFLPEPGEETDPYEAAVRESNVKPSYYDLWKANRYTLPGYFVIKAMLQDGSLTVDEATTIFTQEGWPPDLAAKAAAALGGGGGTTAAPVVKSHTTSAIGKVRNAYINGAYTEAQAATALTDLGVTATDQASLFKVWNVERGVVEAPAPGGG